MLTFFHITCLFYVYLLSLHYYLGQVLGQVGKIWASFGASKNIKMAMI